MPVAAEHRGRLLGSIMKAIKPAILTNEHDVVASSSENIICHDNKISAMMMKRSMAMHRAPHIHSKYGNATQLEDDLFRNVHPSLCRCPLF